MEPEKIIKENWWLIEMAIGLGIMIVLSFALRRVVKLIRRKIEKKDGFWKKRIHRIIHMPLQIAIWGFGIAYLIHVAAAHFKFEILEKYAGPLQAAIIVACFGWIVLRWVKEAFKHLAEKSQKLGVDPGTIFAVHKLCTFVVIILILMIIFQIFGISIAPLLAFGGIGVAGLAFAAQDIIGNFFGGAMLHFTRIFSLGDEIVIPSQSNFMGIVKEIGWYTTVVEDYFRRPVYFPNATFTKSYVINESRRTHRRIKETVSIGYEALPNIETIIDELIERIGSHPDVDNTQSFSISVANFGHYGIEIFLYILIYKVGYIRFLRIKQEVYLIISDVLKKYGAELTYQTTNVNLQQPLPK